MPYNFQKHKGAIDGEQPSDPPVESIKTNPNAVSDPDNMYFNLAKNNKITTTDAEREDRAKKVGKFNRMGEMMQLATDAFSGSIGGNIPKREQAKSIYPAFDAVNQERAAKISDLKDYERMKYAGQLKDLGRKQGKEDLAEQRAYKEGETQKAYDFRANESQKDRNLRTQLAKSSASAKASAGGSGSRSTEYIQAKKEGGGTHNIPVNDSQIGNISALIYEELKADGLNLSLGEFNNLSKEQKRNLVAENFDKYFAVKPTQEGYDIHKKSVPLSKEGKEGQFSWVPPEKKAMGDSRMSLGYDPRQRYTQSGEAQQQDYQKQQGTNAITYLDQNFPNPTPGDYYSIKNGLKDNGLSEEQAESVASNYFRLSGLEKPTLLKK